MNVKDAIAKLTTHDMDAMAAHGSVAHTVHDNVRGVIFTGHVDALLTQIEDAMIASLNDFRKKELYYE